jgi:serine protease Do
VILFTLAIGVLIGTVAQTGAKAAKEQAVAPDATPLTIPSAVQTQNEFTKIAKKLEPSVVNISTEYIPKKKASVKAPSPRRRQQPAPDEDDEDQQGTMQDFMQRFFGGGGGGFQFGQPEVPSAATGSGVVVDKNGYILTNNHVVEKATKIKVRFTGDLTEYPATVIGTDVDTDLAVIHVDRKNLVAAKIGNSDAIQVGDWSIAIGSPLGFQATVTAGIVSALARDVPGGDATAFQHFIQTDAAINPGNSGGPLLNINGEVIGINSMIASRSGGNQGIGFSLPINTAVRVYNNIIQYGHVTRGSIGIRFKPDDGNTAALLKVYGAEHGVFVEQVTKNAPAEKAGIQPEDVVVNIGGKPIHKGQELIDVIADSPVGEPVKVDIIRNKKPMTLSVVVGDRAKIFPELYGGKRNDEAQSDASPDATTVRFGITVQDLRPADKTRMNFKGDGVLVASVEQGSFADDIGIAKNDVIVEVNRQPVNSPADIKKIQAGLKPSEPVAFHLMRQTGGPRGAGDWQSVFLAGKVPEGN